VDQSIPNKRVRNCGTPDITEDSGLGPLALSHVHHDASQPRWMTLFDHHGHQITEPYDASVGRNHAVFKIVTLLFGCRFHAKPHCPIAIFGMQMILPERGLFQPLFYRVPEDAFGLLTDE